MVIYLCIALCTAETTMYRFIRTRCDWFLYFFLISMKFKLEVSTAGYKIFFSCFLSFKSNISSVLKNNWVYYYLFLDKEVGSHDLEKKCIHCRQGKVFYLLYEIWLRHGWRDSINSNYIRVSLKVTLSEIRASRKIKKRSSLISKNFSTSNLFNMKYARTSTLKTPH